VQVPHGGADDDIRALKFGGLQRVGGDLAGPVQNVFGRFDVRFLRQIAVHHHGDDNIRSGRARRVDGDQAGHAAVRQKPLAQPGGFNRSGNGSAGQHRLTQGPFTQDDLFAGDQIRGDGIKGDAGGADVHIREQVIDEGLKILGGQDGRAEQGLDQIILVPGKGLRFLKKTLRPRGKRQAHRFNGGFLEFRTLQIGVHFCRDLAGGHTRCVGAPDQRACAGPGDQIDFNAFLFQNLDHADVRQAADTAAAQGKSNFFSGPSHGVFRSIPTTDTLMAVL